MIAKYYKAKKVEDREWCAGLVIKEFDEKPFIFTTNKSKFMLQTKWVEVQRDTICEYAGTIDATGAFVYENDILKNKLHNWMAVVVRGDGINGYVIQILLQDGESIPNINETYMNEWEIIGNIYDEKEEQA